MRLTQIRLATRMPWQGPGIERDSIDTAFEESDRKEVAGKEDLGNEVWRI